MSIFEENNKRKEQKVKWLIDDISKEYFSYEKIEEKASELNTVLFFHKELKNLLITEFDEKFKDTHFIAFSIACSFLFFLALGLFLKTENYILIFFIFVLACFLLQFAIISKYKYDKLKEAIIF